MKATVPLLIKIAVVTIVSLLVMSCGPISGLAYIVRARIDIDMAESQGADKHAVYEQVAAKEYLQKAKEEYGYSDFIAADEYARKSNKFAKKARERAEMASSQP